AMDEEILNKAGIFVPEDDLDQSFDIDYSETSCIPGHTSRPVHSDPDPTSAAGAAHADADSSQLMQTVGSSEDELALDEESLGDDDAQDDDEESGEGSSEND